MTPALRLGTTGFALIAVCYGFARFAFGLFLPQISADLDLSSAIGGIIAGGSFLGYCVAIIASAWATERFGPRPVAFAAGLVAATGLAGVALATSAPVLAAVVLFAGSSTGLASPPLATAVSRAVARDRQDATNTVVNAGTSAGVALSGPAALHLGAEWRLAFAIFAAASLVVAIAALRVIPREADQAATGAGRLPALSAELVRLMIAAFLMGAASTAVWSFGGELAARSLGWTGARIGIIWTLIGVAGAFGALAGTLVARFGATLTHFAALLALATGILCVGWSGTTVVLALSGAALIGAAYIMLTGVYLILGVSVVPGRPAAGLTISFLMIALGQTVGAAVFGMLLDRTTGDVAVVTFASLGLLAGAFIQQQNGNPVAG